MTTFAELFSDADTNLHVIVPGLAEYYATPSRENARALLVSLALPVPYAALVQSAATAAASRRKNPSAPPSEQSDDFTLEWEPPSSGGGRSRRGKSRAGPSSRPGIGPGASATQPSYVAPFQMIEPPALFEAHRLIDLLHDLLDIRVSDRLQERLYNIIGVSPEVIAELKKFMSEAYESSLETSRVNHRLTDIAEALAGLSSPRSHTLSFKPDHTLAATDMDMYLHAAVTRWYAKPLLEIVLDGIFKDVVLPRAESIGTLNKTMNTRDVARSLTLCAYLQLVMTDWDSAIPAVRLIAPGAYGARWTPRVQTKQIVFLTGDFQTLDVPGANDFIRKWIFHIKTQTEYFSHLPPSAIGTRRISVADMPSLSDTPFANVAVNPSGLRVKLPNRPNVTSSVMRRAISKGTFVPYGSKRGELANNAPRTTSPDKPPPSLADRYKPAFYTSNPKSWLQTVFSRYKDENDSTPETGVFVETLAFVNAFRDAIRAEVALARGAVYITIDALALVYYQARSDRKAGGTGKQSEGLLIRPKGVANLAISYYTPKRRGTPRTGAAAAAPPAPSGI